MKVPRFRIAWVMMFVAIFAIDVAAARAVFDDRTPTSYLFALVTMPMANILAFGLLMRPRHCGCCPFLSGFLAFGAMALAAFFILATCFHEELLL
jgi:hypothetical protein